MLKGTLLFIFLINQSIHSQIKDSIRYPKNFTSLWVDLNAGFGGIPKSSRRLDVGATVQHGVMSISLRHSQISEGKEFLAIDFSDDDYLPKENSNEQLLLIGFSTRNQTKSVYGGIAIGISRLEGISRGKFIRSEYKNNDCNSDDFACFDDEIFYYKHRNYNTIGFPFEVDAGISPSLFWKLGIKFNGNINNVKSYYGIMATLRIGFPLLSE